MKTQSKLTNEQKRLQYVPKDVMTTKVKTKDGEIEAYLFKTKDLKPAAILFFGKRSIKPIWSYKFASEEKRQQKIEDAIKNSIERQKRNSAWKDQQKESALKLKDQIKVGSILTKTWGYSMTIVDFWKVIAIKGNSYTLKRLQETCVDKDERTGKIQGDYVVPSEYFWPEDHTYSKEQIFKLTHRGLSGLSIWDGKPCYENRND